MPRALTVPAFGHADPEQRLLELRPSGGQVDGVAAGSLERPFGLAADGTTAVTVGPFGDGFQGGATSEDLVGQRTLLSGTGTA